MNVGADVTDAPGLATAGDGGRSQQMFEVLDPATGAVVGAVVDTAVEGMRDACEAAAEAQAGWAGRAPRERSELLRAAYQVLTDRAEELALLITSEQGKPLPDARAEVAYAAEFFRWNAEEAVRIRGMIGTAPAGDKAMVVRHLPVGVIAMITPWNFPAAMIARKVAPALAAGNTVVVKPAAETPLTALHIAQWLSEVGVPVGVVNVVPTTAAGVFAEVVLDHPAVRMLSFTGSTAVGRKLLERAAGRVLRTVLELGGNAPFVVLEDADVELAVSAALVAKMRHSGQTCTAANRFYVAEPIRSVFEARFCEAMAAVRTGQGTDPEITCGPLISAAAVARVEDTVRGALDRGARLLVGGGRLDGPGSFFQPTVLTDVDPADPVVAEEIFAPVAPIVPFTDLEGVIAAVNSSELGLAAYLCTGDVGAGLMLSERIEAGMVAINTGLLSDVAAPFGGMKQSGLGREGSSEGIYEFCETQYVAVPR